MKKSLLFKAVLVGLMVLMMAGCGKSSSTKSNDTPSNQANQASQANQPSQPSQTSIKEITIAAQGFSEPTIVDHMLKELIEANTPIKVTVKTTSGLSSLLHSLLSKGEIQIYTGYAGTQFQKIFKQSYTGKYRENPDLVIDYIRAEELKQYGIWVSPKLGFWDNYALTVSADTAKKYNLKTISDTIPYAKDWVVGMDQDFQSIPDSGMPGLKKEYQIKFKKETSMDYNLMYQALASNSVQAIVGYSTDGRLKKLNQIPLNDDKNFLAPEHAIVLINEAVRKEANLDQVLAPLWGVISTEEMTELNYLADVEKQDPAKLAHDFLVKEGLVK